MEENTVKTKDKTTKCELCGKIFRDGRGLWNHKQAKKPCNIPKEEVKPKYKPNPDSYVILKIPEAFYLELNKIYKNHIEFSENNRLKYKIKIGKEDEYKPDDTKPKDLTGFLIETKIENNLLDSNVTNKNKKENEEKENEKI